MPPSVQVKRDGKVGLVPDNFVELLAAAHLPVARQSSGAKEVYMCIYMYCTYHIPLEFVRNVEAVGRVCSEQSASSAHHSFSLSCPSRPCPASQLLHTLRPTREVIARTCSSSQPHPLPSPLSPLSSPPSILHTEVKRPLQPTVHEPDDKSGQSQFENWFWYNY